MSWVLVELETNGGYDCNEESYDYKEIGQVWGPFQTEAEARAHGEAMNEARGYYTWNGREHRMPMSDYEEREIIKP